MEAVVSEHQHGRRLNDKETTSNPPIKADIIHEATKYCPLYEAAEKGDVEELTRLLSRSQIDVNEKSGGHGAYRTSLHGAAGYGHWRATRTLLTAGADPYYQSDLGRTPLHEACAGGHASVVQELLQFMTDTDTQDCHKQTAAHITAFHGEVECLRLLIGCGSNMNIDDKDGCTVAHLAAFRNHPDIIRCLIEEGVDPNCIDNHRRTPAHYAAMCNGLETLKVLAHNDLDINSKDTDGCVPAHLAAAHNSLSCLQYLISAGLTKTEVRDKTGRSLLHMAAINGATDCLHWLLERRANPNVRDGLANTPAHYAATGAHAQCISCLVHHNADLDLQTSQGLTPLDHAKKAGKATSFQDAVDKKICCYFCVAKQQKVEYDLAHQPTPVEKNIAASESVIFKSPKLLGEGNSARPVSGKTNMVTKPSRPQSGSSKTKRPVNQPMKKQSSADVPRRDLATKYFGEHLFSLPEVLKTSSAGSAGKGRRKSKKDNSLP
ncbi:ankyrin repeat, PH and SEC7 domain containing protein secG-like [Actinia tenebrosa]|uniref:Ankyrin repeat, PH and SEC7 domain containing protein secG-like n=1 Tax=Actinia tenebrosa TaxID=6105 RepID=A0A6P8IP91_ACTTE|nr:ankyrin repeat, PH and SEC7 domain containing protein secG-like [Actinia tenebrosa]